jgi:quercetin dioxygenase-like cupin family protein
MLLLSVAAARAERPPRVPDKGPPPFPPEVLGEKPTAEEAALGRKLQEALRAHGAEVHGCYAAALDEKPALAGELLVRIAVAPGGAVERAEVLKDQAGSRRLADCLVDKMRAWRLPELAGAETQQVVFPLAFKPDEPRIVQPLADDQPLRLGDVELRRVRRAPRQRVELGALERPGIIFVLDGHLNGVGNAALSSDDALLLPPRARVGYQVGGGSAHLLEIRVLADESPGVDRPTQRRASSIAPLTILGGKARVRLYLDGVTRAVSLQHVEADAGATVPVHQHTSDEILYIVGGRGEMTVAGERHDVGAGDAIRIPKGTPHSLVVGEKLTAVQLYAPAGPEQRFKAPPKGAAPVDKR